MQLRRLNTFDTVVKTLGGTAAVAAMVEKKASHVSNWKRLNNRIPPKYYLIIQTELETMGFVAADHVFSFAKPKRRKSYCSGMRNVIVHDFRKAA